MAAEAGDRKRILIVGGGASGASCAVRAGRLSEEAEIIVFERGPYISFANCGLPYYIGNIIQDETRLPVVTPALLQQRFNIEVRVNTEVAGIDPAAQKITVTNWVAGVTYQEPYDALVLATGAAPVRPPLPGIDLPGIFTLRTIPDSRRIRMWLEAHDTRRAVVIGGGFIGLGTAENLVERGCAVSIVELLPQVMPAIDPEVVAPVEERLRERGVKLYLGKAARRFRPAADGSLLVELTSGELLHTDLVVVAIGVRPEVTLARQANLALGPTGAIQVDEQMHTSASRVWAVGDAVEAPDMVTGQFRLLALEGPADREGRVAADAIFGRPSRFQGVQGTAVCNLMGLTFASTGAAEKTLRRRGIPYEKLYLHPVHHASYYPDARLFHIKLLFSPGDGRVLGAEAVGEAGVEHRFDVIAMAIQKETTIFDLEQALSHA